MVNRTIGVKTGSRTELKDITADIVKAVAESGVKTGVCRLYVPHTTAGVAINEAADPDVATDIAASLDRLIPRDSGYRHVEGNADSHIKATLVGSSETIPVAGGKLQLGRWQGIFFCEFDGPRKREIRITVMAG